MKSILLYPEWKKEIGTHPGNLIDDQNLWRNELPKEFIDIEACCGPLA